jgi:hypothetical protein
MLHEMCERCGKNKAVCFGWLGDVCKKCYYDLFFEKMMKKTKLREFLKEHEMMSVELGHIFIRLFREFKIKPEYIVETEAKFIEE